jgi:hypothetical protein
MKPQVMIPISVLISAIMSLSSIGHAEELLKAKSYYISVHQAPDLKSKVVGNLLKDQRAQKVKLKGEWVQVNAFKGILVGWAKVSHFVPSAALRPLDKIKKGTSPTLPDSNALKRAQANASPHQGGYRGVQYCVRCHNPGSTTTPGGERPIEVWSNSAHARAYHTLFTPRAKQLGKARGISTPSQSPQCLKCHVTAFGAAAEISNEVASMEGVGCEACHGPSGGLHGGGGEWDIQPIENRVKFCTKCHNDESPTWRGFNLESFSKHISHWGHAAEVPKIREIEHKEAVELSRTNNAPPPPPPAPYKAPQRTSQGQEAQTGAQEGVIILKTGAGKAVHFPHKKHQQELGLECGQCHHVKGAFKCRDCHHDSSSVSRKDAFHGSTERSCRGCHRSMASKGFAAPRSCAECHLQ